MSFTKVHYFNSLFFKPLEYLVFCIALRYLWLVYVNIFWGENTSQASLSSGPESSLDDNWLWSLKYYYSALKCFIVKITHVISHQGSIYSAHGFSGTGYRILDLWMQDVSSSCLNHLMILSEHFLNNVMGTVVGSEK